MARKYKLPRFSTMDKDTLVNNLAKLDIKITAAAPKRATGRKTVKAAEDIEDDFEPEVVNKREVADMDDFINEDMDEYETEEELGTDFESLDDEFEQSTAAPTIVYTKAVLDRMSIPQLTDILNVLGVTKPPRKVRVEYVNKILKYLR